MITPEMIDAALDAWDSSSGGGRGRMWNAVEAAMSTASQPPAEDAVERVARALFDRGNIFTTKWGDCGHEYWKDLARAAIQALSKDEAREVENLKHDLERVMARENQYLNEAEGLREELEHFIDIIDVAEETGFDPHVEQMLMDAAVSARKALSSGEGVGG